MELQDTSIQNGLCSNEVEQRIQKGYVNTTTRSIGKSTYEIIKDNVCTLFNLLNLIIACALIVANAWTNILFIFIIILNILIGIVQELHAKKLVDQLTLFMAPSIMVIRDGKETLVDVEDVVLDDVMVLSSGEQICCDAYILQGSVEVNEALLSGESDPIHKHVDQELLSGSSIISGRCLARVIHVGSENYAQQIAEEVKQHKALQSELMRAMRKVTRITCLFLIPLGMLLIYEAFILRDNSFQEGIISLSAALLGMLPKGLVLLISVSLASGVTRLAKKNILVQDLYSLETLAHVDTLCLDKTGTITNGSLEIVEILTMQAMKLPIEDYISSYLYHSSDNNATFEALCAYFPKENIYKPDEIIPFSSSRKWASAYFPSFGSLIVGAPDRILSHVPEQLTAYMQEGKRVIVIAHQEQMLTKDIHTINATPIYAVVMKDSLRTNIQETISTFYAQGVDIKVISGDHPLSVSAIAKEAGIRHAHVIDMSSIENTEEALQYAASHYSVFGRVTPKQKKQLIQALQKLGHHVAMTGDGVNDMLAMKEADCSITVAQGSDAVKQMAQIVLMDSDFSSLTDIVMEGRRVINNITRVAGVFFIKTLYSIALTLLCVLLNIPFPFIPIQITLIDAVIEAFPSFFSILECDTSPIKGSFLTSVFQRALPNAIAIILMILIFYIYQQYTHIEMYSMMYLGVAIISMKGVITSCIPFTPLRIFLCGGMITAFLSAIILFPDLLQLTLHVDHSWLLLMIASLCSIWIAYLLQPLIFRKTALSKH